MVASGGALKDPSASLTMVPPPVLGFNNNVRHRGYVFHIQTEDSGVNCPRIVTHLFADGGHIIKTTRTDYARHVGHQGLPDLVRQMMKAQHKAMAVALWAGELDALLESALGPLPLPPAPRRASATTTPNHAESPVKDERPQAPARRREEAPRIPGPPAPLEEAPARPRRASQRANQKSVRPQAQNAGAHSAARSEPPLDEEILSYLASDLDASLK